MTVEFLFLLICGVLSLGYSKRLTRYYARTRINLYDFRPFRSLERIAKYEDNIQRAIIIFIGVTLIIFAVAGILGFLE